MTLLRIDRLTGIGDGNEFQNLDPTGFSINLNFCCAPTHFPDGRIFGV
jgi:hypothetical protein